MFELWSFLKCSVSLKIQQTDDKLMVCSSNSKWLHSFFAVFKEKRKFCNKKINLKEYGNSQVIYEIYRYFFSFFFF